MTTIEGNETATSIYYIRLSQFYQASCSYNYKKYPSIYERILQRGEDVNYAVPVKCLASLNRPDCIGYTPLHFAAMYFNESGVELLLNHNADFTLRSQSGLTALRLAIERATEERREELGALNIKGKFEDPIADLILSAHVSTANAMNPSCKRGISHFHIACMTNNRDAVELFLKGGVVVNQAVSMDSSVLPGFTPLHFAARYCSLESAQVLLKYNADINLKDATGLTPLQMLIERNKDIVDFINLGRLNAQNRLQKEVEVNDDMIELLEKHRTDNSECSSTDEIGLSHFHIACTKRKNDSVARNFMKCGADIDTPIHFDSPICAGYTSLHVASHFNRETVKLLVENGGNIEAKDVNGVTPVDLCMERYTPEDIRSILPIKNLKGILTSDGMKLLDAMSELSRFQEYLERNVSNRNVIMNLPLWSGYTPLHILVAFGKSTENEAEMLGKIYYWDDYVDFRMVNYQNELTIELISMCIEYGADTLIQNDNGMTPLHLAFRQKKKYIVETLIPKTCLMKNPSDNGNLSHFHILCVMGYKENIKDMLKSDVNINSPVEFDFEWHDGFDSSRNAVFRAGSTPLHISVIFDHASIAKLLLEHGADPLAMDNDGLTPLHRALMSNFKCTKKETLHALLSSPAIGKVNPVTSQGLSHFHAACFSNNVEVVEEFLRLKIADVDAQVTCQPSDSKTSKSADCYNCDDICTGHFRNEVLYAGYGPLHFAVKGRAMDTLKLLLKNGGDVRAKNAAGLTPLQFALSIYTQFYDRTDRAILHRLAWANAENGPTFMRKANNGMTTLHVVCLTLEKLVVVKALELRANVNAQLDPDSPIWPGETPLHMLIRRTVATDQSSTTYVAEIESIAKLLLEKDVDVNLKNAKNVTLIHAVSQWNAGETRGHIIDLLLCNPRTFEANPVNDEGLSHFHVACMGSEPIPVEEFLSRGLADVHRPKDHSADREGGFTPLHFAMGHSCRAVVEVLLRHGAKVDAEDNRGSTPLHVAAQLGGSFQNVEAILRTASWYTKVNLFCPVYSDDRSDVNARNIFGETPLELCLKNNRTKSETVDVLMRHGARVNVINPVTSEGLLAMATTQSFMNVNHGRIIFQSIMKSALDLTDVDPATGLNAIHNVTSNRGLSSLCIDVIAQLMKMGCELDHRDIKGRTALHLAVEFEPVLQHPVRGLLENGADIDVTDEAGKVPLDYLKVPIQQLPQFHSMEILLIHIFKLVFVELDISERNKSFFLIEKIRHVSDKKTAYFHELERMEDIEIDKGYSLRDFLTKAGLANYPVLSQQRRESIGETVGLSDLREKFPELSCLLKLQYRKAVARFSMMEPAKDTLEILAGFGLPDPCSEALISFLSNEDLKSLIASSIPA